MSAASAASADAFVVSDRTIQASLCLSLICGALVLLAFAWMRGWMGIYQKRMDIEDVDARCHRLRLGGLQQAWSYFKPIFTITDEEVERTAGLDALVLLRTLVLGIQLFLPLSIFGCAVLLPINLSGKTVDDLSAAGISNSGVFMYLSLANIPPGSDLYWVATVFIFGFFIYAMWLLSVHYRSYVILRLRYLTHVQPLRARGDHGSVQLLGVGQQGGGTWRRFLRVINELFNPVALYHSTLRNCADNAAAVKPHQSPPPPPPPLRSLPPRALEMARLEADTALDSPTAGHSPLSPEEVHLLPMTVQDTSPFSLPSASSQAVTQSHAQLPLLTDGPSSGCVLRNRSHHSTAVRSRRLEVDAEGAFERHRQTWPLHDPLNDVSGESVALYPWWLQQHEQPAALTDDANVLLLNKTVVTRRQKVTAVSPAAAAAAAGAACADEESHHDAAYRPDVKAVVSRYAVLLQATRNPLAQLSARESLWALSDLRKARAGKADDSTSEAAVQDVEAHGGGGGLGGTLTQPLSVRSFNPNGSGPHKTNGRSAAAGGGGGAAADAASSAAPSASSGTALFRRAWLRRQADELFRAYSTGFPDTFKALVPVYNHKAVDALLAQLDAVTGQYEQALATNVASSQSHDHAADGKGEPPAPAIQVLLDRQAALEQAVLEARQHAMDAPAGNAYFALFSSQRDALVASRCPPGGPSLTWLWTYRALPAPAPEDVNWQCLWTRHSSRVLRRWLLRLPLLAALLFPIGVLTGTLTNLEIACCSGTPDTNKLYWPWFCGGSGFWFKLFKALLTGLVPTIFNTFFDTYVMPIVFFFIAQAERSYVSLSGVDRRVGHYFFLFDVINSFIMVVLSGGVFQQIGAAISNNGSNVHVLTVIGQALPGACNFFFNNLLWKTFFTNVFRFVWPHDGTFLFVIFRALGMHLPKCARDHMIIRMPPSFRGGRHFGAFYIVFIIGLTYAVVNPVLLPLCLGYFLTAWLAWKYCILYFYEHCYESGGQFFEQVLHSVVWTLHLAAFFTAAVLISRRAWVCGGLVIGLLPLALHAFTRHMEGFSAEHSYPLEAAVHDAPAAVINPLQYLPPGLRNGAIGWYPEQQKVWEKYGIPRYV